MKLPPSWCHGRAYDGSERTRKNMNTALRWFEKQKKILGAKGGSWRSEKMDKTTTHERLTICIFSYRELLLLGMLLIRRWTHGIYVFLPYVRLINYRFHLVCRSSASSFSSQYLLLFLKSSRSCVLLFPIHFANVICPSWRRQFLLRIWPIKLAFLHNIIFRSALYSPICSGTCSLVTFSTHFISEYAR